VVELLADHDPGQPWPHWGCALCDYRAIEPQALEVHTAAEHPGSLARYETVRPIRSSTCGRVPAGRGLLIDLNR
jgi:hypothetical protein